MSINFEKFDKAANLDGLKEDIEKAKENGGGTREEVPAGNYEVKVEKMELTESKKGDPMVSIWFRIINGQFEKSMLFFNQVVNKGFQIHIVNELLKSLESEIAVEFESYSKYGQMLMDIHEAIDGKLEYGLKYGENKQGFKTFEITDVFEVED